MRDSLDRMMSEIEQLKSGNNDQIGQQRHVLIGQLAQNNCGAQYASRVRIRVSGPQGFFDALFGGGTIVNPDGDGAPSGTYSTVCVRTCDGFYFPISYSTVPSRFADDQQACQRLCPAAQATLYTYHNPGEEHRTGGIRRRPALYGAAERIPLSQKVIRLLVPAAGPDLGGGAQ